MLMRPNRGRIVKRVRVGIEVLRMYKHDPKAEYPKDRSLGAYINRSVLDSGEVYVRLTKDGPAKGSPLGVEKNSKWAFCGFTELSPEKQRIKWVLEGFRMPKSFFVGGLTDAQKDLKKIRNPRIPQTLLKRLEERSKMTQLVKEKDALKARFKMPSEDSSEKEWKESLEKLKEPKSNFPSFSSTYWDTKKPLEDWKKRQAGDFEKDDD